MPRRMIPCLAALGLALGCTSGTASTTPTPTPTPSQATALGLSGPARIAVGACGELEASVLDQDGKAFSAPADVTLTVTAGALGTVYSDDVCSTASSTVVIPAGNASAKVYFVASQSGPVTLDATDDAQVLTAAQLIVSIDAILLASQAVSRVQNMFNNTSWYALESTVGVPMQAQVTVPVTGDWYIEVHGRATIFDGNNAASMARLREDGPSGTFSVDFDEINLVNGATASTHLAFVNSAPVNGMTYTYTVEVSTIDGNTSIVNPKQFTFGPGGDQISDTQSMVMAVVRPARYEVLP